MYVNVRAIIEREGVNGTEVVIQKRMKAYEGKTPYELPGGQLEEYESLLEGLKREVLEETGLHVTAILGVETKIETNALDSNVEVMKPFAVYQTLKGPVDSMGVYFRCHVTGDLVEKGDETEDVKWIAVDELKSLLDNDEMDFSWVDQSGVMYYLNWYNEQLRVE